jgi:outer membrane murein-binding lipoprotein Lpp
MCDPDIFDQLVQQKRAQADIDTHRSQLRELTQAKNQLQTEVTSLREELSAARIEAAGLFPHDIFVCRS